MLNVDGSGVAPQRGLPQVLELRAPGASSGPQVLVSDELLQDLRRAARIHRGKDESDVTFSALLLGLSAGDGALGRWLRLRLETEDALDGLLRLERSDRAAYEEMASVPGRQIQSPRSFSASASRALRTAAQSAPSPTGIEPADVLMAMLTLPDYHEPDFKTIGIDRAAWARDLQAQWPRPPARADTTTSGSATADPPTTAADTALTNPKRLESHVARALRVAHALAGSEPVTPVHVLTVIRAQKNSGSPSFDRLRQLMGPAADTTLPQATVLPAESLAPPCAPSSNARCARCPTTRSPARSGAAT